MSSFTDLSLQIADLKGFDYRDLIIVQFDLG